MCGKIYRVHKKGPSMFNQAVIPVTPSQILFVLNQFVDQNAIGNHADMTSYILVVSGCEQLYILGHFLMLII